MRRRRIGGESSSLSVSVTRTHAVQPPFVPLPLTFIYLSFCCTEREQRFNKNNRSRTVHPFPSRTVQRPRTLRKVLHSVFCTSRFQQRRKRLYFSKLFSSLLFSFSDRLLCSSWGVHANFFFSFFPLYGFFHASSTQGSLFLYILKFFFPLSFSYQCAASW